MPHDVSGKRRGACQGRGRVVDMRRTNLWLEPSMWSRLIDVCRREQITLNVATSVVAQYKPKDVPLTAAIRVFVMSYFDSAAVKQGQGRSGAVSHVSGDSISLPFHVFESNMAQPFFSTGMADVIFAPALNQNVN